jgi:hypothetical protein
MIDWSKKMSSSSYLEILQRQVEKSLQTERVKKIFEIDEDTTEVDEKIDLRFERSSDKLEDNYYFTILKITNTSKDPISFLLHLSIGGGDSSFDRKIKLNVKESVSIPTDARWRKDVFNGSYVFFE